MSIDKQLEMEVMKREKINFSLLGKRHFFICRAFARTFLPLNPLTTLPSGDHWTWRIPGPFLTFSYSILTTISLSRIYRRGRLTNTYSTPWVFSSRFMDIPLPEGFVDESEPSLSLFHSGKVRKDIKRPTHHMNNMLLMYYFYMVPKNFNHSIHIWRKNW